MAKNDIYKITLINWAEHNPGSKKHFKKSLIPNNFLNDAKLRSVPVTARWMFLGIVLTCGDHARDTIEMSESQLRDMLESSWSIERALHELQALQILTFEKTPRIERKEEKRRERIEVAKKIEKPAAGVGALAPTIDQISGSPSSRTIAKYCEEFKRKYGTNPEILKSDAGRLGRLAKELGEPKAFTLIAAYFAMPDPWVVKNRHSVGLLVTKVNEIKVFAETGDFVTMSEVRDADKNLRAIHEQATLLSDPEFQKGFDDPAPQIAGGFE